MNDDYYVYWRGHYVGKLNNLKRDMWYVDGDWFADSEEAEHFAALASRLDAKEVLADPSKGTRVLLRTNRLDNVQGTHALVISLSEGNLFLRQVFRQDAIAWLEQNVK